MTIQEKTRWTMAERLSAPLDVDLKAFDLTIGLRNGAGYAMALVRGDRILPSAEAQEVLHWLKQFYELVSDEAIEYHNHREAIKPWDGAQAQRWLESVEDDIPSERKNPGYVYLIGCGPWFKIGASTDPQRRMGELGTLPPFDLTLVHTIYSWDMYALERELHKRFENKRKNGEWFELDQDDVSYIKTL